VPGSTVSRRGLASVGHGEHILVKIKRKDVVRRGVRDGNGESAHMNATATIAPAGPQYMRALERANKVRLARAELKRRVALGEVGAAEVILDCPWEAHSMAVADLLMSQRRWGQTRCRKFLAQISMSEKKTVGSMTDRQRRTLAAMLTAVPQGHDQTSELDPRPYQAPPRYVPAERRVMALSR
jgi:hypothetical protein